MTVTRVSACRVKGCPAPKDPDFHIPHCGHGLEGHHHHVPKRSQGGKRIVAFLCPKCHDEVDNGISLGNQIWKDKGGREHYLLYDMAKGPSEPIVDRVLEAGSAAATEDGAEGRGAQAGAKDGGLKGATFESSVLPVSNKASDDVAAAPSASGESRAAEPLDEGAHPSPARDSSLVPSPSAAPPSFSKDGWCREGMQLVYWYIAVRDATDEVRFKIGDWYNEGDRVLGEEAPGYLRGFEDVTVRQYSWVAGRVSPDTRVSELSWTMHRAVAALEAPKQKEWLERAQEENLSSKGLYRAIHGEKPKVRRYTAGDLRGWANQYGTPPQRRLLLAWIDWLEAK